MRLLKGFPLFHGVHESDLRDLLRRGRLVRARDGETLWPTVRGRSETVALIDGWAKLHATDAEGERTLLRILQPGDLAGLAPHEPTGAPVHSLQALGECRAVVWKSDAWNRSQRRCPRMSWNVIRAQTEYLRELQRRWVELAGVRVEARLARTLIRLAREAGRRTSRGTEIEMPLSREDLAELVGATIHTVSRTLGRWERAGCVVAGWKRAIIVDVPSLRRLVETADEG